MKGLNNILLIISALWMLSCEQEKPITQPQVTLPENKVRLKLDTNSQDYTLPSNRASANENDISDATYVFVFEGSAKANSIFSEVAKAELTSEGTFVVLSKSSSDSHLLVIVNSPAQFYDGQADEIKQFNQNVLTSCLNGKTLTDAEDILLTSFLNQPSVSSAPYVGTHLPMSGIAEVPGGIGSGTTITNAADGKLYLKRIVAKTNVGSTAVGFELLGATAIQATCAGHLFALESADLHSNIAQLTDYLAIPDPVSDLSPLYLYESRKENQTSIIIKGKYKDDVYYYKLIFTDKSGNLIDIIRNKHYKFEITSVTGPGKPTLELAAEGPANNINYYLIVSDDNSHDIIGNGKYYLGVSNSELIVYGEGNQSGITAFYLETDADVSSGIIPNSIICAGTGLTIDQPVNYGTEIKISLSSSFTEGAVTICLGDLVKTVKISRRKPLSYTGIETINGNFVSGIITARGEGEQWLSLSTDGSTPVDDAVQLATPGTIYIMAPGNISVANGNNRTGGEFFLSRNNEDGRVKFIVSQECLNVDEISVTPYGYIGAFWRKDQTGERLIRIPHQNNAEGGWTAMVIAGQEWIKLDTEESADANIGWKNNSNEALIANMNTSTNDELYQVSGNATSVSGNLQANQSIYFRIGLKTKYQSSTSSPARYGVILLSYNDNTKFSKIYIRQGEDADYLMSGRQLSRRFAVYNVTAPAMTAGGNQNHLHPHVDLNKGAFTEYPSQTGAYLQFANSSNQRFAYHPVNPSGAISSWNSGYATGYWGNWGLANSHESCPSGFRRPYDGSITTTVGISTNNVNESEMRQSLYLNPQNGTTSNIDNVLFGYYADGFFDRRKIVDSPSGSALSAVSVNNHQIAYAGYLFFNPGDNHSLFFPQSGLRSNTNGSLQQTGSYSAYWSGSVHNDADAWVLTFENNTVFQNHLTKSKAISIRCVRLE